VNVLVLGGKGFIGRHVVRALAAKGCAVVVGTRHAKAANEHALVLHRLTRREHWIDVVARFDVIVNCVGILRERWGETYANVYLHAPAAIAQACAAHGKRFIHITALGLHANASSGFLTTKLAGEQAIAEVGVGACIVRPSLLDGPDGFGSRWLRRVAQWPVHLVPSDARGELAPLDVKELGEAIAALCACPRDTLPASVELGGETRYLLAQYLKALRTRPSAAVTLHVPAWMVRVAAHALDVVHWTPLSWGHVELMRRDNAPRVDDVNALRQWLGRAPTHVGARAQAPVKAVAAAAHAA
jgi:uncharacterized protein YbjT (DUF2867 family)